LRCDKSPVVASGFREGGGPSDEALALPKDPVVRDSAIQRFEISFELCWKFLKAYFVAPGLLSFD